MKKILNKKWTWLLVLPAIIAISSCKKNFLDRKPLGRYTEEDIAAGSFEAKVFGAYAMLRNGGFNNHEYLGVQSYRSDESEKGSSVSDGAATGLMYDEFEYNTTGGGIGGYWTDHYLAINAANDIIHSIDSTGTPEELNIAKSAPAEIFTLIDADLQEAAAVLPLEWESKFISRTTKGAAVALQTRVYLWQSNWSAALASAKNVIGLGKYSLVPKYGDQFRSTGENGTESIFEIQAFYTPTVDQGIIYANVQKMFLRSLQYPAYTGIKKYIPIRQTAWPLTTGLDGG